MNAINSISILVLAAAFTIHLMYGSHGEHWFALDVLARKCEELERRVKELERRDA